MGHEGTQRSVQCLAVGTKTDVGVRLRFDLGLPWGRLLRMKEILIPEFPANSWQACERGRKSWEIKVLIQHRTSSWQGVVAMRTHNCKEAGRPGGWGRRGEDTWSGGAWRVRNRASCWNSVWAPSCRLRGPWSHALSLPVCTGGQRSAPHRS